MTLIITHPEIRESARRMIAQAKARRLRTMREFAEREIYLPEDNQRRYSCETQPYARLWFDAVDSGLFRDHYSTGPSQSGKTLTCTIVPTTYHLFEVVERVIYGLPDMDMAKDKWELDVQPVIEASRYREFLPTRGDGSKGGTPKLVRFGNGAPLRFMGAGGGDKQRAHYTARVLVATEINGYGQPGKTSTEGDKLEQMIARLRKYDRNRRIFGECTVTDKLGKVTVMIETGTDSRIALPCPGCGEYVTLGREHLVGWQEADSQIEAEEKGRWICPECGALWDDAERRAANRRGVLVHKGQTVDREGVVHGPMPPTRSLGFRWSAVNNLFAATSTLAGEEWLAARAEDLENTEKVRLQFVWATEYEPPIVDMAQLDPHTMERRKGRCTKGLIPADTLYTAIGIDAGQWYCHWVMLAWRAGGWAHMVDRGVIQVPSKYMLPKLALTSALRDFRDTVIGHGWAMEGTGEVRSADLVWIDSGWEPDTVYAFCRESNSGRPSQWRYWPTKGWGSTEKPGRKARVYTEPQARSGGKAQTGPVSIGERYHVAKAREKQVLIVHVDVDHWKAQIHGAFLAFDEKLGTPKPGALELYDTKEKFGHQEFIRSVLAEKQVQEFVEGKGTVTRWVVVQQGKSHFLDAAVLARCALHARGARPVPATERPERKMKAVTRRPGGRVVTPDGRAFVATQR
jgi:phage terminase large subunit GpA-like protein